MVRRQSIGRDVRRLLDLYPKIYFACHTRHVRDPATGAEVSRRQAQILDHLDTVDAVTVSGLAHHLGVTASTMSLAVDRLERQGFARRVRDADDGRRVRVVITPAGQRIQDAHSVLDPERVRILLARLTPDTRRRALEGLAILAAAAFPNPAVTESGDRS